MQSMKVGFVSVLAAIIFLVTFAAPLHARSVQDCSGRGDSIAAVVASTAYCNYSGGGNTTESKLVAPVASYYPSPFTLAAYYYHAPALLLGAAYAPWLGYGFGGTVNPSVYYHSSPPIVNSPYYRGR